MGLLLWMVFVKKSMGLQLNRQLCLKAEENTLVRVFSKQEFNLK